MSSHTTDSSTNAGLAITDLLVVVVCAAIPLGAVVFTIHPIVRVPLGILAVLVLPGYALIAALFPCGPTRLSEAVSSAETPSDQEGITLLERTVLSVGSSLVVVVLSGIAIQELYGMLLPETLLTGVFAITAVSVVVAAIRRRTVAPEDRYAPSIPLSRNRLSAVSRPDALAVLLVVSVLFAGGAVAYTELETEQSPPVTEFYFLTDPTADAAAVDADPYPTTFVREEPRSVSVAVRTADESETTYTLIAQLQEAERRDGTVSVNSRTEQWRQQVTVAAGETEEIETRVEADTTDQNRLVYLLYRGEPPATPDRSTADRAIHLWVEVTEPPVDVGEPTETDPDDAEPTEAGAEDADPAEAEAEETETEEDEPAETETEEDEPAETETEEDDPAETEPDPVEPGETDE